MVFFFFLGMIYGGDGWIIFVLFDFWGCVIIGLGCGLGFFDYCFGICGGVEIVILIIVEMFSYNYGFVLGDFGVFFVGINVLIGKIIGVDIIFNGIFGNV